MSTAKKETLTIESRMGVMTKVGFLILTGVLLYHPVMAELLRAWMKNHYYSHGFLIPLISGYVVFRERRVLNTITPKPFIGGAGLVLAGIVTLFVDDGMFNRLFISSSGMLIFTIGGILLVLGKECLKVLLFPTLFLLFMVPVPQSVLNFFLGPLQLIAASIGEPILRFLGITVFREGIYLYLATITIEVAETCSSMHSLIALSALSFFLVYLMDDSAWKKIIVVCSSIPLAITGNAFRLVLLIVLALWMGDEILKTYLHPLSGKILFMIELGVLFLDARLLQSVRRS